MDFLTKSEAVTNSANQINHSASFLNNALRSFIFIAETFGSFLWISLIYVVGDFNLYLTAFEMSI